MKNKYALVFLLVVPALLFSAVQKSKKKGLHLVLEVNLTQARPENSSEDDWIAGQDKVTLKTMAALKERMNEAGVQDAVILRMGSVDRLLVQIPDPKDIEEIKHLLTKNVNLEIRKVESGPFESEEMVLNQFKGILPSDLEIAKTNPRKMDKQWFALQKNALISSNDFGKIWPARDAYGGPAIGFKLAGQAGEKLRNYSSSNMGARISFVLDNQIILVVKIQDTIGSDGIINGRFTSEEVQDLVCVLRSPLPADIRLREVAAQTVFPVLESPGFPMGGTLIAVSFSNPTTIEEVRGRLKKVNFQIAGIQQIDKENKFFIFIRDSSDWQSLRPAFTAALPAL